MHWQTADKIAHKKNKNVDKGGGKKWKQQRSQKNKNKTEIKRKSALAGEC